MKRETQDDGETFLYGGSDGRYNQAMDKKNKRDKRLDVRVPQETKEKIRAMARAFRWNDTDVCIDAIDRMYRTRDVREKMKQGGTDTPPERE